MSLPVIAWVLAAALAHATWNALLKGRASDPHVTMAGLAITWAVGIGIALPWLEIPAPESWPWIAASVAVHCIYMLALVAAYRAGEMSVVYPIVRGVPPLLVLAAFVVMGSAEVTLASAAGVACVSSGVVLLGISKIRDGQARRAIALMTLTVGCVASYLIIDGIGVRLSNAPLGYWAWQTALQGAIFAVGALARGRRPLAVAIWSRRWIVLVAGVLSSGGYAIALWAFARAPVASVAALRETSVLFGAVIATAFLRERFGARRAIGALLVAGGAILLRLG